MTTAITTQMRLCLMKDKEVEIVGSDGLEISSLVADIYYLEEVKRLKRRRAWSNLGFWAMLPCTLVNLLVASMTSNLIVLAVAGGCLVMAAFQVWLVGEFDQAILRNRMMRKTVKDVEESTKDDE